MLGLEAETQLETSPASEKAPAEKAWQKGAQQQLACRAIMLDNAEAKLAAEHTPITGMILRSCQKRVWQVMAGYDELELL